MHRKSYPNNRAIYLWDNKSLCIGPSSATTQRQYGAVAFHVGLYSPFKIIIDDHITVAARCAYIPVNTSHRVIIEGGIHGKLFIERHHINFLALVAQWPVLPSEVSCFFDQALITMMQWIYETQPDKEMINASISELFKLSEQQVIEDNRIQKIIELTSNTVDQNYSHEALASNIYVSPYRFLHLFKQNTNMPYRRYRRWARIQQAIRLYYESGSITQAAIHSGFSDASHFSNSFKQTYGVKPSQVFNNVTTFEIS